MPKRARSRIVLLYIGFAVLAALLFARLFQLQVHLHEELLQRAASQQLRRVEVPATRGSILDREGRELAVSVESESLYAHPKQVTDKERVATLLAPVIQVSKAKLLEQLESDRRFVYLRRFLDSEQAARVRELDLAIGGSAPLGLLRESRRVYPRDSLAVHAVGYANIDGVGVEGIEQQFDHALKGDPTVYLLQRNAGSGELRRLVRPPENEPWDVVLTIDLVLQHFAERELDRAMRETGARAASALLIDPSTGQILALANRPTANPNQYGSARPEERINRAVVHVYEPGSTFKFVPAGAALEQDTVTESDRFFCENGTYYLGRRRIRDTSPHGMLTLREIFARSSNICMVKVAQTLDSASLRDWIVRFGFGTRTGVELPGESPGILAPLDDWSDFSHASLAFGQEIAVSVLQMGSALATVANDGVRVPPRLVLATRNSNGRERLTSPPRATRVVSVRTARELRSLMESVVRNGTGHSAAVPGYRVGGKSGTAQKALPTGGYSETDYVASFGGFGPIDQPRLACLVVLDSPKGPRHQGGQVSAPVFSRIMTDALRYLRAPNHESSLLVSAAPVPSVPPGRPSPAAVRPGQVPALGGMSLRQAVFTLTAHGYRAHVTGSGIVVAQNPPEGTRMASGETCSLRLGDVDREAVQ